MLKKFSVTNFKNFQEKVTFDLGKTNNYQFNTECISNKIVNKAIIYGKNASGKTNLILGITDIIGNITDYGAQPKNNFYTNLLNDVERSAVFEYELCINDKSIIYRYEKKDQNTLVSEVLYFNNEVIVQRNSSQSHFTINIPGLENFDNTLEDVNLSVIK